MKKNSDINLFLEQFYKVIYVDFGIKVLNEKLKNWYKLSWEEFKKELIHYKANLNAHTLADWEYFFNHQKNKVLNSMH